VPKQIDKLKKERYKQERLQGKSIAKSMINAGCAVTTAYHDSKDSSLVKTCERELMEQVKASDITVEWVVNRLTQELVAPDAKASDRIRVSELLGKYLNMFKDTQNTQVIVFNEDITRDLPPIDISQEKPSQEPSVDATTLNSKGYEDIKPS